MPKTPPFMELLGLLTKTENYLLQSSVFFLSFLSSPFPSFCFETRALYIDLADLKLVAQLLSLPQKFWETGVHHLCPVTLIF